MISEVICPVITSAILSSDISHRKNQDIFVSLHHKLISLSGPATIRYMLTYYQFPGFPDPAQRRSL